MSVSKEDGEGPSDAVYDPSNYDLIKRLLGLAWRYRLSCLKVLALQLFLLLLTLGGLGFTGLGIDYLRSHVQPGSTAPTWPLGFVPPGAWSPLMVIGLVAALVLLFALFRGILTYIYSVEVAKLVQARIVVDLRSAVYEKLQRMSFKFFDANFRVYAGPKVGDIAIAKRKATAGAWTHLAVTRSTAGDVKIYINGELDTAGAKRSTATFDGLNIGQSTPPNAGTAGELMEFRVWKTERRPQQIRENFDRRFAGASKLPQGLAHYFPFGADPTKLSSGAKIAAVAEAPKLLNEAEAKKENERLAKFRAIAARPGADAARGKPLFTGICLSCHNVGAEGAGAAPPLDGSGHRDLDSLLRAVLTPDAAVEPGYRVYRIETKDGRLAEGFLVKHDENYSSDDGSYDPDHPYGDESDQA